VQDLAITHLPTRLGDKHEISDGKSTTPPCIDWLTWTPNSGIHRFLCLIFTGLAIHARFSMGTRSRSRKENKHQITEFLIKKLTGSLRFVHPSCSPPWSSSSSNAVARNYTALSPPSSDLPPVAKVNLDLEQPFMGGRSRSINWRGCFSRTGPAQILYRAVS
jgi:hypothetical protein